MTFSHRLARNLEGTGIMANCLHPGDVNTKILRAAFPGMAAIIPEEGARASIRPPVQTEWRGYRDIISKTGNRADPPAFPMTAGYRSSSGNWQGI